MLEFDDAVHSDTKEVKEKKKVTKYSKAVTKAFDVLYEAGITGNEANEYLTLLLVSDAPEV